tara:strand:+ start:1636 stop:3288 length:1653 start_codon:yes stop_codon:yes gene_type:complete
MKLSFNHKKIIIVTFYLISILIVLFSYEDYGIHIEEKFHRLNGLYWLNYISNVFGLVEFQKIIEFKIGEISDFSLSSITTYNKYGILLDIPSALLEILFNINEVKDIYYFKHLLSFFIFLLSSIFFFKIIQQRFKNFFLSFLGLFLYITTPRILGDSFLYKDVLFLSFFSFTLYFFIKSLSKFNLKNLIFLAVFSALCVNLRIFAILIPLVFVLTITIKNFYINNYIDYLKKVIFYLFFFTVTLYIFWPYLWADPLSNFLKLFTSIKKDLVDIKILYDGDFISNKTLPDTYIFNWIFLTSPFLQTILFFFGYIYCVLRLIRRFINIKDKSFHNDLWRGREEEVDFVCLIFLSLYYFFFIFLNAPLYNGWRLLYFFNIFIIYFIISFLHNLKNIFRKKKINKFLFLITISLIGYNIYAITKTHPFQSMYFNSLVSSETKNNYEGDYYGLATKHFFEKILSESNGELIKVAVASHTPIQRGLEALPKKFRKRFEMVGQEYDRADYIYKNNISEVNSKIIKKYDIPKNFSKIYEFKIDEIILYEIFKPRKLNK